MLPANTPHERRVREEARRDALDRIASIERKLDDVLIMGQGVASAAPSPAIRNLALDLGQDRILLPTAITISRTLVDEGEIATHISFGHVTLTIEEAARLGVLLPDGRFNHYRAGELLHERPQPGAWVHPMCSETRSWAETAARVRRNLRKIRPCVARLYDNVLIR